MRVAIGVLVGLVLSVGLAAWAGGVDSDNRLEVSIFGRGRAPAVSDAGALSVEGTITVAPPTVQAVQGFDGGYPVEVSQGANSAATSTPWYVQGPQAAGVAQTAHPFPVAVKGPTGLVVATTGSADGAMYVAQNATSTPWIVSGTVAVSAVAGTVNTSAQTAFANEATSCGLVAASIPAIPLAARKNILIQNQGPGTIRIGLAPTASFGVQLASGASLSMDSSAALKCIAEAATSTAFNIESK